MTYQIIDELENVTVTNDNIAQLREAISATDQANELKTGEVISTYGFLYEGEQRGQLTVYHSSGRAAVECGGDSNWGDWDHDETSLRLTDTDDTHVWVVAGSQIWEESDTSEEEGE